MDCLRNRYVVFVLAEIANLEIDRVSSNEVNVADAVNSQCLSDLVAALQFSFGLCFSLG